MAKKGRRATNEERLVAVQLHENGMSVDRVAEVMNAGISTVSSWVDKYRRGGLAAISTKAASGRPTVLDDSEMIRLYTMINGRDPRIHGFGMALWTRSLIRDLIRTSFAKSVSLVTVGRILKKLGMSAQRPLYRSWKQDPEGVAKYGS
ncbi:MAG: winged helix-turn-helix domain-containing protein [Pseudonocardiales bacterium]